MSGSITIFLSYNERDRERAAKVVRLLESGGWTVWWDRRIPAGRTWRDVLADALARMDCMVVLWSRNSIDSDWVCEEASEGQRLGKLVPVALDPVLPPVGFRQIQAADLSGWDGSANDAAAHRLLEDIAAHLRAPLPPDEADRIDDAARRREAAGPPPPAGPTLADLRSRMLTARDAGELQRLGWELDTLARDRPDWIEARELRAQLEAATQRARRLEAPTSSARPAPAGAPAARGAPPWLLGALLALGLAIALAWWLWWRPIPPITVRDAAPVSAQPASPAGTTPVPVAPVPTGAKPESGSGADATPQRGGPGPAPASAPKGTAGTAAGGSNTKSRPTDTNPKTSNPRCADLLSRQSLGESIGAADRAWMEKECR